MSDHWLTFITLKRKRKEITRLSSAYVDWKESWCQKYCKSNPRLPYARQTQRLNCDKSVMIFSRWLKLWLCHWLIALVSEWRACDIFGSDCSTVMLRSKETSKRIVSQMLEVSSPPVRGFACYCSVRGRKSSDSCPCRLLKFFIVEASLPSHCSYLPHCFVSKEKKLWCAPLRKNSHLKYVIVIRGER